MAGIDSTHRSVILALLVQRESLESDFDMRAEHLVRDSKDAKAARQGELRCEGGEQMQSDARWGFLSEAALPAKLFRSTLRCDLTQKPVSVS